MIWIQYQDIDPRNNEIVIAPLQGFATSDRGQYAVSPVRLLLQADT